MYALGEIVAYCLVIGVAASTDKCCGGVLLHPVGDAVEPRVFGRHDTLVANAILRLMVVIVALIVFVIEVLLELVVVVCHLRDLVPKSSVAAAAMERFPWLEPTSSWSRSSLLCVVWPSRPGVVSAGLALVKTCVLLAKSYLDHVPVLDVAGACQDHEILVWGETGAVEQFVREQNIRHREG